MCYHCQVSLVSLQSPDKLYCPSLSGVVVTKREAKLLPKNVLQVFPLSSCSSWKYSLPPPLLFFLVDSHMWWTLWYQRPMRHTCGACCSEIKHPASFQTGTQPLGASGVGIPDSRCLRHTSCSDQCQGQSTQNLCHWGWRQQKLSVSLPKFRGTFYQHPAINSASRKVKCDPVQCSRAPGCCDSSAAALWACVRLIYCNCWPWLVLYT